MLREQNHLTRSEISVKLGIPIRDIYQWERGSSEPSLSQIPVLAAMFHVSTDWLLTGKSPVSFYMDFTEEISDRLYDENRMYNHIKHYAQMHRMHQTAKVLPYATAMHKHQYRKGRDHVPYIYHPLLLACHALALGLDNDDFVSAALLHDVCEDCDVAPEELPVNERTREVVRLLTNYGGKDDESLRKYYDGISTDPMAIMLKLIDRCNNISDMTSAFPSEKIMQYIAETEKWVYPLLKLAKEQLPMYTNQLFLIKYHMLSVITNIKRMSE